MNDKEQNSTDKECKAFVVLNLLPSRYPNSLTDHSAENIAKKNKNGESFYFL